MKIDRSRVRKSTSEVPLECQQLIERLQQCSRTELLDELSRIHSWTFGKCELLHWAQVLDIFDKILGEAAERSPDNKWILKCDTYIESELNLLICILRFTSLLIEHSFSRHLYNSMEHLLVLQESNEMSVVLEVLNLLYMFSKRSNFITRLKTEEKECLLVRLSCLGESWGGKENGFGLADCCNPEKEIPSSATTLHVEFHPEDETQAVKFTKKDTRTCGKHNFNIIHIEHIDKLHKTPAEIMKSLISLYYVPPNKEVWLFTHVRLASHFADYQSRLKMVQARLQALSVIVYSNAIQEVSSNLLYNGLLEELVEVVELQDPYLSDIRCAALRTLTAIIHLDRGPHLNRRPTASRLNNIIDVTGASLYHGFLPALVRNCISSLTNQVDCGQSAFKKMKLQDSTSETDDFNTSRTSTSTSNLDSVIDTTMEFKPQRLLAPSVGDSKYPVSLTTALFSFLYHLASYQAGGEALVSCGMMESLLQVINWQGFELDHINFVTRAVRVIDLITNIDMTAFQTYGGLYSFINRLDIEVNFCKKEQIYRVNVRNVDQIIDETPINDSAICSAAIPSTSGGSLAIAGPSTSTDKEMDEDIQAVNNSDVEYIAENTGKSCLPQRAALLKSMLNFLKKAFNDAAFSESIRHLMEGTLPNSLKNLIANAEYYGPSLFLLATDVVTVYVYQEPSLLSALQENGLTDIILYSLLVKEVPATREVLGSLPNVFSALCLNNRGLEAFAKYNPFNKLFNILLSPNYLPAMRRRRSSEPTNDTASVLGNAMDELMRHQPSLRQDATVAIINLLKELVKMGTDPKYVCWRPHSKSDILPPNNSRSANNTEGSSDEEDDDEEEASTSSQNAQTERLESQPQVNSERQPIALIDYILNAMKFIDSILSNNSTDDHCREFCEREGIEPLLQILGLPNLPVDCPVTNPAQAVATVCKSILNLAHEPFLFSQGLAQLDSVLKNLKPLYAKTEVPGASKLLLELVGCSDLETAFSTATATPILHAMNAAHGYVIMFVHICRTGQTEIRNLSLQRWGSSQGLAVLKGLSELYTSLVWESTLLLAYCSDDLLPSDCDFTREDIEKLNAFFDKCEGTSTNSSASTSDNNTPAADTPASIALAAINSSALDHLTSNYSMDLDGDININKDSRNLKIIKPLLGASSRLGRALAELFGLLVKLCVGPPVRQRRGQNIISAPPIPSSHATNVATALNKLLVDGLDCEKLPPCPNPKCRLTFLICSIGFTSPMLFDERRYPYHLMLKKFISLDGQNTLFKTFQWALDLKSCSAFESIDYAALPEGTLGFLDAWLTLVEKLVNPKTVIESPHVISNRSGNSFGFDPFNYLKRIHRQAFENVKLLWRKKRAPCGERTTETLLTIMRHIFRGEKIIKEKLKSEETKSDTATISSAGPSTEPAGLRQLVDMGFSRESALEALQHTSSLEHATEYLLSNPSHLSRSTNSMDVGLEEDQVQQAIAISLESSAAGTSTENAKPSQEEQEKLFDAAINDFAINALEDFLKLLDELPDTVHKVCDLLVTLMKRNTIEYSETIFDNLIDEMMRIIHQLSYYVFNNGISIVNYYSVVLSEPPQRLHSILHLFILLFESPFCSYMKGKCGLKLYKIRATTVTITLITRVVDMMIKLRAVKEPKWLAPGILFVDLLAKADVCHTRKIYMHLTTTRIWRWYDLVTGRWAQYSNNNNRLINEAYWSGEPSIRVTCGRKRYTITFANMLQVNDETGNNRPICMTLATFSHPNCSDINSLYISEPLYTELTHREENRALPILGGTTFDQKLMLIKATCDLLALPTLDKNILHSALQLSARLTRDYEMAKVFVHNGGIKSILAMRQLTEFNGFGILSTVLIRHTLEEPNTLQYSMEKIIRGRTLSTIPPPYKDLIYMIRQISGAVARHPYIFWYVAAEILRADTANYKGEPPEVSLPVRVEPPSRAKAPPLEDACSFEVISDLLKALLEPLEDKNVGDHEKPIETIQFKSKLTQTEPMKDTTGIVGTFSNPEHTTAPGAVTTSNASSQTGEDIPSVTEERPAVSAADDANKSAEDNEKADEDLRTPEEKERSGFKNLSKKPMLPKSVILKILADAVVSYGPIAKLITDFKYKASDSEFLTEDTTALAFIFDKILPTCDNIADSDCSTMSRMLIAALASSNHSPEAQITLVSEVKLALIRALNLPESSDKHHQIQNICGIISTMIDNCPLAHPNRWTNCSVNNIVKLMIRRGIFNDLAKITHYLDLSSPHTPFTANSALKPLESLSRTINQPGPNGNQSKNRKSHHTHEDTTEPPTLSTEQTNAQGEELEDTENTEHDISAVASSLENNSVSTGRLDNTLEEMMQHILQHRSDNSQGYNDVPSSRNTTMDIDEECTIDYDHERDATEELMSTDSGESDSNPSDQVDDDGNDDNDGDDDNIDDNDDNDDSNFYDDDNDRRRGGGAMFRLAANDRDEDILMIQYETETNTGIPRMIRWNENGFTVPLLEHGTTTEPPGTITHPLLISRAAFEAGQNSTARNQRNNRTRRYQYLFSPRNPNPPVILQRLLGPDDPHLSNVLSSANNFLNLPDLRENARVVVMDNFGIIPSNEEQIDFVDQSGYLFGPSLAATLSYIPPVLHWWNIESKLLDMESTNDAVMFVCNKLIPVLINTRNEELRNKKAKEKDEIAKKTKQRSNPEAEAAPESVVSNDDELTNTPVPSEVSKQGDEDLDGEPVEISDTSNESSQDGDVLLSRLPSFLRGNENSQTSDVTQNASVQTIDPSEPRMFNNRSETSETSIQNQSNPFEMSLTAYVRSRNNAFGRPVGSSFQQHIENLLESQGEPIGLDVQTHNNPLRAILEETVSQQTDSPSPEQPAAQHAETSEHSTIDQREPEPEGPESAEPTTSASTSENSSYTAEQNAPVANADVVIAGPSSSNDDEEIPEGVDPSFLEALPPEIRREVLEQHRILCIQQRYRAAQESGEEYILTTPQVNPDFLAALPPSLQEEVLSQHRMELQRQAAARANPDEPVDAASFFETLQPSLRTMILSDMEDSQMSVLPPDLAQEAQNLRRDWYARNRQMAQERFLQTNLSAIYRHSRGRQSLRPNNFHRSGWGQWSRDFVSNSAVTNNQIKIRGRQLLDHEGIACLLILLFTDDSHLNKLRLHRVIRNLCYHAPTREWVINCLLSIIEKSVNVQLDESLNKPTRKGPKPGPLTSKLLTDTKHLQNGGHWLTIRMEAALGCAANVFILNKATGKKCDKSSGANTISIHPQAAPIVCRNTLDLLTSLAKAFPSCLIPVKAGREEVDKNALTPVKIKLDSSDFWDVLIRLDCSTKKGKSIQKQSNSSSTLSDSEISITFDQTAFGKLLNMLASPVVKRNTQLTDNLLKLLSVTTSGMPDLGKSHKPGRGRSVATEIINKPPTNALNLVVNVITYQNCSEEGLEFITHLLLNLANSSLDMSFMILNLLLNGAVEIGSMVEQQIQDMLKDLRDLIGSTQKRKLEDTSGPSSSKGVIYNRFTNEQVIVTASTKVKSACELQLPSMVPLTSKSSSQVFFLRVLRVIVQIRNSIKQSMKKADSTFYELPALSEQLTSLNSLWNSLSLCLFELEHAPDHHAVLVLQPTVEAFFLVHSPQQGAAKQEKKEKDDEESAQGGSESESAPLTGKPSKTLTETQEQHEVLTDPEKSSDNTLSKPAVNPEQHFLAFAETHRTVLNQILRQSTAHLADGPFAVLVDHTRILDFDIKRRYFRTELERMDHGVRREETAVHVRRSNIFEDSFRELFRRPPEEWKNRFYIVFEDEEGQDAGGLLREWYVIISRDIFNPMYALFTVSPGDRVTYMINSASHYNSNHLCYYKFVGRVIAKAIYDNKLLECYFTRSFYKHILGIPVKYTDMESEDYSFYRGLVYLMENNISNMDIDLTFSTEISEFGVTETRDLIPNGRHIPVTEENKMEYIRLVCQMKMTGAIKQQLNSFLEGFYDIIPMRLISIFNEQELELLISGLPNVDIEDLKANTEYHKYQTNSLQIQWFWRALRSFDQADRAKFLQFVTGTSKVPLQGFGALEGMNGVQKFQIHRDDRSTDRLPSAHTCFNQLDLPVYETYDKLRAYLLKAIHECSEGFGFA